VAFPIETIQSYPGQIEEAMLDFRTSSSFPQDCIAFVRCDPSTESLEGESFPSTGSPARGLRTVCAYSTDGVQKRFRIPLRTLLQGVQSGDITAGGLLIGSMSENGKCARLTTEALESLTNDETAWSAMVTIWSIRKDTEDEE
jgi:hypothetical protein